jgi:hypothetical protein
MPKRKTKKEKREQATGLLDLGAIDETEFEQQWNAAGGTIVDGGSIEDATDESLAAMFNARSATEEQKAHFASLIVARGLTACGCEDCQNVEAYAKLWDK